MAGNYNPLTRSRGETNPAPATPPANDPSQYTQPNITTQYGSFTNPYGNDFFSQNYSPSTFVGDLINTPAAREYTQVGDQARALGVQGIRSGESSAIESGQQDAASKGLGRAAGSQIKTNARQQGSEAASEMVLGADMEQKARRFQLASLMATAGAEGNKARFSAYLQKKALKASKDAAASGAFGQIAGGFLGAVGSTLGAVL